MFFATFSVRIYARRQPYYAKNTRNYVLSIKIHVSNVSEEWTTEPRYPFVCLQFHVLALSPCN